MSSTLCKLFSLVFRVVTIFILVNSHASAQAASTCVFPDSDRSSLITIIGEAKSIAKGDTPSQLIYCEYHFDNSLVPKDSNSQIGQEAPVSESGVSDVEYYAPDGTLIAKKTVDFSQSEFAPDVRQEDMRHGELRVSERLADNEGYRLFYLPPNAEASAGKELTIEANDDMVIDAGFDNAIRAQWDNILSGNKIEYTFLVAPSLRTFGLKVIKRNASACEQWGFDSRTQVCLRVSSASMFINLFIKPITLIYEREGQRLVFFNGTVNISNDKGKQQRASIRYYYQPLD